MENDINIETAIIKYLKGNCTDDELAKALNVFEDSQYQFALRNVLYDFWDNNILPEDKHLNNEDKLSVIYRIHHNIHQGNERKLLLRKGKKIYLNLLKIAVVLIIGLISGVAAVYFTSDNSVSYTSITPNGSVSQFILPDKTMVYLNSGSRLTYNKKYRERNIHLEGEAWFEVNRNDKVPFIVETPHYNILVKGTKFNVKAYSTDDDIVTTLEEGRIEIHPGNDQKNDVQVLEPGQQLIFNKETDNFITKSAVNTKIYSAWKENRLIFINMNLKELIKLLERKYGVNIIVRDKDILDYHYDGTIKNETIIEVLNLLKETLPITYIIEGQNLIISK